MSRRKPAKVPPDFLTNEDLIIDFVASQELDEAGRIVTVSKPALMTYVYHLAKRRVELQMFLAESQVSPVKRYYREAIRFLFMVQSTRDQAGAAPRPLTGDRLVSLLSGGRYFFGGEDRKIVDAALGDIKKDAREMRRKCCGVAHIRSALLTRAFGLYVPLVWANAKRIVSELLPLRKVISWFMGHK